MTIPRIAQTPRADHTIARLGVATSMVTVGFTIRAIFNGLLGGTRSERCVAFNDIERKRIEHDLATFMAPPPHIRPELDFGYRISGHSVEIFEIRPQWQNPKEKMEHAVAKATFVRTRNIWRVFWMRSDLKWYGYEPVPEVRSLAAFLAVVGRDEYCCFFG